jgi:aquaporin Z
VNYVATVPGPHGITAAFAGEIVIAFVQMTMVLNVASRRSIARFTGVCAGGLVALYISVEAPLSGMSLNPARSLAPAWFAGRLDTLWIYFVAPLLGMGLAAELHVRTRGLASVLCAKLHHRAGVPCPFNCTFHESSPCPPSTSTSSSSGPAPAVAR